MQSENLKRSKRSAISPIRPHASKQIARVLFDDKMTYMEVTNISIGDAPVLPTLLSQIPADSQVAGGLIQAMTALAKGNYGEVVKWFSTAAFKCERCGVTATAKLDTKVRAFMRELRRFERTHNACVPLARSAAADVIDACAIDKAKRWEKAMLSDKGTEANNAVKDALKAIQRARELCERAQYGTLVLDPLADAQRSTQYALDTVLGRN